MALRLGTGGFEGVGFPSPQPRIASSLGLGDILIQAGGGILGAILANKLERGKTDQTPSLGLPALPTAMDPTGGMQSTPGGGVRRIGGGAGVVGVFPQASGLYHVTPTGRTAATPVVVERGPSGEVYAAAVKRISMAKLKRHILTQIRSRPKRHHHHHHHPS